jgi:hypothetical protein
MVVRPQVPAYTVYLRWWWVLPACVVSHAGSLLLRLEERLYSLKKEEQLGQLDSFRSGTGVTPRGWQVRGGMEQVPHLEQPPIGGVQGTLAKFL